MRPPTLADIRAAAERIEPHIHRTPVVTCRAIDQLCGAELHFKCENLQRAGSFKMRGATNAVFSLTEDEAHRGVVTHSSGNHGQALALAAARRGIPAYVVMPTSAPSVKRQAVAGYGAEIIDCAPNLAAREAGLAAVLQRTGAIFVHPYNDSTVIAGQGTAALELIEQVPGLDLLIAPVGGGGLLSGTSIAVAGLSPQTQVFGAEPAGADDANRSLAAGRIIPSENPDTIADGLLTSLGDLTFAVIQEHVPVILTVSDDAIVRAMRLLFERAKLVVEPSGAVPLAAVLTRRTDVPARRVGLIISGGNVDLAHLPWCRDSGG